MLNFKNDYNTGCAKPVLDALIRTNDVTTLGYGVDEYTQEAIEMIKKETSSEAYVHFMVGGTITNATVISLLRPYEAVISCDTGHINVHETGAIEQTGHKIIAVNNYEGKISAKDVLKAVREHEGFHMVIPKMVYISNTTEYGTVYTKEELLELRKVCDENNLYLFIDGARLGAALAIEGGLTLKDMYELSDVFYIGGTKNGLLFGEAIVIRNDELKPNFKHLVKNRGALLAKGRLLGVQFIEFFKNNYWLELARHANRMADIIREKLDSLNVKHYVKNETNQIFIYIKKNIADILAKEVYFEDFIDFDDEKVIRIVTSWSTKEEDVILLTQILDNVFKSC